MARTRPGPARDAQGTREGNTLDPTVGLTLCGAALLTAAISGVLGMAGGIMLLAVMLLFLEPAVAIPIHALAQLASNSSRSLIHARAVRLELLLPFAALVLPAGFMTLPLAQQAPAEGLRLAIGSFVLVSVWRSRWLLLGLDPESVALRPRFALLGAVSGALGPIIGATGPLIAPFFLGIGLTRFEVIGTKAACQTMTHLAKLLLFGLAGFSYFDHLPLLAGMAASVVAGTALGTRVLHRIDDARFIALYKIALTAVAIRLLWGGLPDVVLPF